MDSSLEGSISEELPVRTVYKSSRILKSSARFQVSAGGLKVCGFVLLSYFVIAMSSVTTESQRSQRENTSLSSEAFEPHLPIGISRTLWRQRIPPDNPMTAAK